MVGTILAGIGAAYKLTEKPDSVRAFTTFGMEFNARGYWAEGFGHVGLMTAEGMPGKTQLETLILNPFFVDAPILSYDRIHGLEGENLIIEMFDSLLGDTFPVEKLERLAGDCPGNKGEKGHWYDSLVISPGLNLEGEKKDAAHFDDIAGCFVREYVAAARMAGKCDPDEKRRKAAIYSEGLLSNGGPATDPVKRAMGQEWTEELFRGTLFGTGEV